MADTAQRLDILYEAHFSSLAFDVLTDGRRVFEVFYSFLMPRFQVTADAITVSSSAVLSEVVLRIGLFGNRAAIEMRPDRMTIRLPNIGDAGSLDIARELIALCDKARTQSLPAQHVQRVVFVVQLWIQLEGGAARRDQILTSNSLPGSPIKPAQLGAERVVYSPRFAIVNGSDKWGMKVIVEPSLISGAELFIGVDGTVEAKPMWEIGDQMSFADTKIRQLLIALGVNPPAEG
jgi:hypothetical protein